MSLFYDSRDSIIELLDKLSPLRRKQLLEDAKPAGPGSRSYPDTRKARLEDFNHRSHTLIDEFDHRTLETEIDGGFAWFDELPQNIRAIAEGSDCRVDCYNGQISKVVRKRDPEFLQGEEHSFGVTTDGNRVPLTDDVYDNEEVEFVSIDSEFSPPKDRWDLIFNADPLIKKIQASRTQLNAMNSSKRAWVLQQWANDLIYSSDWFPTKKKIKPFRTDVAALIKMVQQGIISRAGIYAFCNPITEEKLKKARTVYLKASRMNLGKQRAALLTNASKVRKNALEGMKKLTRFARLFEREQAVLQAAQQERIKTKDPVEKKLLAEEIKETTARINKARRKLTTLAIQGMGDYTGGLSITDKKNLWDEFFQTQIRLHGEVKLSRNRFKKMYYQQLFRKAYPPQLEKAEKAVKEQEITEKEMKQRLKKVKAAIWKRVNIKTEELFRRKQ